MDLVVNENLDSEERRVSLSEFHTADEVQLLYFHLSKEVLYVTKNLVDAVRQFVKQSRLLLNTIK